MKAKKWLTIITLAISIIALVLAFAIGKESNSIFYDIEMAILGSALLGFIMSLTEYFVEKQKSMEEFWLQATKVLKELRKIKYLDAPAELVLNALQEENSNEWIEKFSLISENTKIEHIAKESLIS